jgi:hypothetical protein
MPERSVFYDGLSPTSLQDLGELSERLAMQSLQQVNQRAMELQERDSGKADAQRRMTFGMYFYRDADPKSPTDDDGDA